jgi:transcription initiation factor TFIID TATA-box-binding protein
MQAITQELRDDIKIQNVVCTAEINQSVDIGSFNKYESLNSNLNLYACGYVKDEKMVGRVTVFANGKLISVGTKSPQQAKKELKKAVKILKNHGLIKTAKIIPNVRNIVGRYNLEKKLDIETLARSMPKSLYEPEQFPGLIFRIQGSLVALLFASGKGVLVGGKTYSELNQGLYEVERWIN